MNRPQYSFIIISLNIILINGNSHQKCCGADQQIVEEKSNLRCDDSKNARLQETFEKHDFSARNESGTCVEIFGKNVALFAVENATGQVEEQEAYEGRFFPKCCPLNHRYNTTIHGCEGDSENTISISKKDSFVRVGLPECMIISDKILDSIQDVKMNGKDLILLKDKRVSSEKYCVDSTSDEKVVVRICEDDLQICSRIRCIHKCCPDGQSFINGSFCHDTFKHGVNLQMSEGILSPDDPFVLVHGFKPKIHLSSLAKYNYHVDRFGVFSSYSNQSDSYEHYEVGNQSYCAEYTFKEKNGRVTMDSYFMFLHSRTSPMLLKFTVTRWIKVVSCFFSILTISIYLLLPKMRNLFGKISSNYCVSTSIFFASLAFSQFYSDEFSDAMCKSMGFLSVLSSIWSFTWLHIMCIDIWFSFGNPRTLSGPLQKNEWKRLSQYSLYGWGFPLSWVLMIAVFNITTIMPEAMHPIIGKEKCYSENSDARPGNYSYIIYVTLPSSIQQVVNIVLFVKIIMYCLRIKAEIERMNDTEKKTALYASKERFGLIIKSAVIMGVFFTFETVSSFHNFQRNKVTEYIEVVWDSINCSQGVFIFLIFICKEKVYRGIRGKISNMKTRKTSLSSSATTQVSMHTVVSTAVKI